MQLKMPVTSNAVKNKIKTSAMPERKGKSWKREREERDKKRLGLVENNEGEKVVNENIKKEVQSMPDEVKSKENDENKDKIENGDVLKIDTEEQRENEETKKAERKVSNY